MTDELQTHLEGEPVDSVFTIENLGRGRMCSVDGCELPHYSRGWCRTHHHRWVRHGNPLTVGRGGAKPFGRTPDERFWPRVDKTDSCWMWTGQISKQTGYGMFSIKRKTILAHRFAYETTVGPIPEGLHLDHTCHNGTGCRLSRACPHRRCVNPDHLEAVLRAVNLARGEGVCAQNSRKTHCPDGHPYAGANLMVTATGSRMCRICRNSKQQARRKAARA